MSVHPLHAMELDGLKGIRHGFFTRAGGVSTGIYHGLNCGPGSNDDPSAVELNRTRVAIHLQVAPENLLSLYQVHSGKAVTVTEPWDAENRPQADGMATATRGLALGILTADCAPVLFADPTANVIGAAHAGWRGAAGGIVEATLAQMEGLGARRADTIAVVGPAISQENYEVGPDLRDEVMALDAANERFFVPSDRDGHWRFDLEAYVLARLRAADVGTIGGLGECTYADDHRFFSFRRTTHRGEKDYGRQISVITLA
ncbi:peptidoglycan editing factor PgeF [Pyruvatibacter mobilis]|uniref:peptidoglycan editing factor PgeF n=1 Tax=Pyruvatibacter mobilis TaxID=1712261 RepID=UPI003BAA69FF